MSVKPIDIKSAYPKTQQLSKLLLNENNRHKALVQNEAMEQTKKIQREQKKINRTEKGLNTKIHKDEKEKKNNKGNKRENNQNEKQIHKESSIEEKKHGIGDNVDIKV